jgi:hypothetical protein
MQARGCLYGYCEVGWRRAGLLGLGALVEGAARYVLE